jgi:hypothetical protein
VSDPLQQLRDSRPRDSTWVESAPAETRWDAVRRAGVLDGFGPPARRRQRRFPRRAGMVVAAVVLIGATAAATSAITTRYDPPPPRPGLVLQTYPVDSVRSGDHGSVLEFSYTGGDCARNVRPVVKETITTVTVSVAYQEAPNRLCDLVAITRDLSVNLVENLGARTVIDGRTGKALHVFDGSQLLQPTWLPPGFTLDSFEEGLHNGTQWTRGWSSATRTAPTAAACTPGAPPIWLTQGTGVQPDPSGTDLPIHPLIRGEPGTVQRLSGGRFQLTWSIGEHPGTTATLFTEPTCANDPLTPLVTLLHVARGLH